MKTIQLNKLAIELPESWEDLSYKEKIATFGILGELFSNAISPEVARLKMLIEYTGYKPSAWQLFREGLKKSESEQREIINFNLLKLSEQLTFAFSVEENRIIPNHRFLTNPIHYIKIGKSKYYGKIFELDITAKTDITAREFADCFDLLSAQQNLNSDADREECVNQICSILYPRTNDYKRNLVSGHHKLMRSVPPVIKFGIVYWFTGVVRFYTEHEVYSLIFQRNKKSDSENKISIGMNEISLALQKEGYGNSESMNLNDYFDAQIKYLKDIINKAIGEGIKPEKLSEKTGIPYSTIQKLS
ncbi:MAG: hypothetical protein LBO74_02115 [Candidatus Symbiothrix sp.]|jgi:hypothetical protein|nr:hypothetical protein [Candidatus Symbiothrix sp.]